MHEGSDLSRFENIKNSFKDFYRINLDHINQFDQFEENGQLNPELINKAVDDFQERDDIIRELGIEIEEEINQISSKLATFGSDHRFIMSSVRMIYDFQRISREFLHIVEHLDEIVQTHNTEKILTLYRGFNSQIEVVEEMLSKFIDLLYQELEEFKHLMDDFIREGDILDNKIDEAYEKTFSEIITSLKNDDLPIEVGANILYIVHYLERMGDHCLNLIERTVYVQTGER